jgi:hypothetical protein
LYEVSLVIQHFLIQCTAGRHTSPKVPKRIKGARTSSLAIDGGDDAEIGEKIDNPLLKQRLQRSKRTSLGVAHASAGQINIEDGEALIGAEKVRLQISVVFQGGTLVYSDKFMSSTSFEVTIRNDIQRPKSM